MKKNILLVDDDQVFNFLNQKVLEKMGIADEIHTALNGQEALEFITQGFEGQNNVPDIIFLDLNMPIMNGFDFLEAYQKLRLNHEQKIYIVIISSSQNPEDIHKVKQLGANHYLVKPISEKDIRSALVHVR